jgi:hypothetical protein
MPIFLALIFLNFLPCIIKTVQRFLLDHMSAIANQKFNQLHLQGYQPLVVQRTAMRAPTRMQESEDLVPYSTTCQQEAAKRPTLCPNSQSQVPTPSLLKKKWGNGRIIMSPFCE